VLAHACKDCSWDVSRDVSRECDSTQHTVRCLSLPLRPAGIADPWGGGTTVFDPAFLCIGDPGNPLLEMAPPPLSDDAQVLQAFKAAIPNLDDALASSECSSLPGAAWEAGSMPCGSGATGAMGAMMPWRGVTCDAQGDITAL
jgi:hypothetical protein